MFKQEIKLECHKIFDDIFFGHIIQTIVNSWQVSADLIIVGFDFFDFFNQIEQIAYSNHEEGKEIGLTRQQLIDLCVKLNGNPPKKGDEVFVELPYGKFFLN
jgi:hypothetical protein